VTAPLPSPHLSPIAGLTNALLRFYIRCAGQTIAQLEAALAAARELNERLREAP
jgi:hypothetical protein